MGSSSLPSSSWFPCLNCSRTCGSPPDGQQWLLLAGRGREREQRTLPCAYWSDHGMTAGLGEPAPRNLVYIGNTDDLLPNRHFYLWEKTKKVITTNQKSVSTKLKSSTNQRRRIDWGANQSSADHSEIICDNYSVSVYSTTLYTVQ